MFAAFGGTSLPLSRMTAATSTKGPGSRVGRVGLGLVSGGFRAGMGFDSGLLGTIFSG